MVRHSIRLVKCLLNNNKEGVQWIYIYCVYANCVGGLRLEYATNIVFTQGDLDPWMPAGVPATTSTTSSNLQLENSVVSVVIEMGGHHLDLFWPTEEDPQSVR